MSEYIKMNDTVIYNYQKDIIDEKDKEIERLNNIINELENFCEEQVRIYTYEKSIPNIRTGYSVVLNELRKLKGSDKVEIIEDNTIEKTGIWFSLEKDCENDNIQYLNHNFKIIFNKIDEIIDYINKENKDE